MAEGGHNTIIIKKIKKAEHGHHGGAWKVAYADFVTAMMAFFLLLWLLSVTTDDQKRGLADYFAPTTASLSRASGAGDVLSGRTLSAAGSRVGDGGVPSVVVSLTPPPPPSSPHCCAPARISISPTFPRSPCSLWAQALPVPSRPCATAHPATRWTPSATNSI